MHQQLSTQESIKQNRCILEVLLELQKEYGDCIMDFENGVLIGRPLKDGRNLCHPSPHNFTDDLQL